MLVESNFGTFKATQFTWRRCCKELSGYIGFFGLKMTMSKIEHLQGHPETGTTEQIKQYPVQNPHASLNSDESSIGKRLHAMNFIKELE